MKKTIALVVTVSLIAVISFAQAGITAHNHLGLQVADLKVSTKFYGETLGLTPIEVPENLKAIRAWFKVGTNQIHLLLGRTQPVTNDKNGSHIALSVADIAKSEDFLKKNNIVYHRQVRFDGVVQLFFNDPDGYVLEFNEEKK